MSSNAKGGATTPPNKNQTIINPCQRIIDINVVSSVLLQNEIISFDAKMQLAKQKPPQRTFVGNYIYENELTLLFAPTSYGKSVLAMTTAIGISAGAKTILNEPNDFADRPQTVLYLDFEMSDAQLRNRYENLPNIPNLFSLDLEQLLNRKQGNFQITESDLSEWIDNCRATVIVIDNMGAVLNDSQNHTQAMELVFMLHRLTRTKGVSIILISHATKGVFSGAKAPIHIGNSEGSYKITAYCDHVLGLGKSPEGELYLRHLKSRNGQDQSIAKPITIINEPYLMAEASEIIPLSELFPSSEGESEGRGRKESTNYSEIAKQLFSNNLPMSYSDMQKKLLHDLTVKSESSAKHTINKLVSKDLIFKSNDCQRYFLKVTEIDINQPNEKDLF